MNLKGTLLIAPPSVKNNFWYKTVILVTEHHSHGSIGLVLNKHSPLTVTEFGERLNFNLDYPGYVYQGGPVSSKNLCLLHSNEWSCRNTIQITKTISLSSADDMLPRLEAGDTPKKWRLFLGMCGWGPNQLDTEINSTHSHDKSWCVSSSNCNLIYESDNKEQWVLALEQSSIEFAKNSML